ncbi:hypothetical protein OIE13_05800 [Streptosporangium sp. NBC_01810]|uniref:hypothetical protein n=1 Tax=Streptosporangium sp. NBC_01810 TaxID=2975951 RepID=UPI002DD911F3|nr:hypothetical protein [Streptosporangium sp. NBC_01810]WSA27386.1 hypothetical protein OIE13_05800 [Streptosporangium sp. NBC_01810]
MSSETAWPAGVIARYLTVGGATVDLTEDHEVNRTEAACTGCPTRKGFGWTYQSGTHVDGTYHEEERSDLAAQKAREWAQSHAEKCRAMPKPNQT